MAEAGGLPSMPSTVNLSGGQPVQGDPLELMRNTARETIESVNGNPLPNDKEKIEFKKYVLKKLKEAITKFDELDAQAEQKAQEAKENPDDKSVEEEDPFADIFGEEDGQVDESMQEKNKIAQEFVSELKLTKEKYLKDVRIKRENEQAKEDKNKLQEILGKLDDV
ncbi:hypothetical protein GF369_03430 [Candidatus Peregrinibacteria bacterium]|nr:hypothetical protein [Candidatus Peregrinibacteria bacterium]